MNPFAIGSVSTPANEKNLSTERVKRALNKRQSVDDDTPTRATTKRKNHAHHRKKEDVDNAKDTSAAAVEDRQKRYFWPARQVFLNIQPKNSDVLVHR